jgi:uncharacterized protein (TIGR02246 family)
MTIARADAETWLARYGEAWRQGDPELACSLFAADCRYFETPYSEPAVGRDGVRRYWQAVPDGQRDVRFDFNVLAVDGDRVVAHWTASFVRMPSGANVALDGMFLLEFSDARHCRTLREWWHREERGAA